MSQVNLKLLAEHILTIQKALVAGSATEPTHFIPYQRGRLREFMSIKILSPSQISPIVADP